MINIEWPFYTHMDFCGQKMAERLFQVIISLFGIIGFIIGYMMQQFSMTIYSVLLGTFVAVLLTLPPWPIYRNNPIQWQKTIDSSKEIKNNSIINSSKKDK
ncbi:unnamed protein product [Rotaria sp. Silwood1]|nr:unnamed protein product [Rotaria sp. Silwood1]CAF3339589.1 unnamed protein product [Rotaria sp. Silwood1]CAF3343267.1 unnamed protein product [Rotaria sp. Silwood1]CAF4672547.1 unnamed protein product [Rotaria sp. Silwood1]CAF4689135.1 unnamed protein product [Rotaria sp. Silwood1]